MSKPKQQNISTIPKYAQTTTTHTQKTNTHHIVIQYIITKQPHISQHNRTNKTQTDIVRVMGHTHTHHNTYIKCTTTTPTNNTTKHSNKNTCKIQNNRKQQQTQTHTQRHNAHIITHHAN